MPGNILVCIKQILDTSIPLEISQNGNAVVQQDIDDPIWIINPVDIRSLGLALELKRQFDYRVTIITLGPDTSQSALTYCLARGTDSAIHLVCSNTDKPDAWAKAKIIWQTIQDHYFDIILCGDRSLDSHGGEFGPFIAELMNIPQITKVMDFSLDAGGSILARRYLDPVDREIVHCSVPVLMTITASGTSPIPCYVPIKKISQVNTSLMTRIPVSDYETEPNCRIINYSLPKPRPKKVSMPESSISATERMKFRLSGGPKRESTRVYEGAVNDSVGRIINFIREIGIIEEL